MEEPSPPPQPPPSHSRQPDHATDSPWPSSTLGGPTTTTATTPIKPPSPSPAIEGPSPPSEKNCDLWVGYTPPPLPSIRAAIQMTQTVITAKGVRKRSLPSTMGGNDVIRSIEERRLQLQREGRRLIEHRLDYHHENRVFDKLMQDRIMSQVNKSVKASRANPKFKKFSLGRGIHHATSSSIVSSLAPLFHTLDSIDLSNQCIGQKGCRLLSSFLQQRNCHVVVLKLRRTQLMDSSLALLCKALARNESITAVDMSHNSISHASCAALGEAFMFNSTLKDLCLAWNNCHGKGLQSLCTGIAGNKTLKRLDLSWNLLGRKNPSELDIRLDAGLGGVQAMAHMIRRNKAIRHLDLSNCCLSPQHAKLVAEAFNQNHTITGIHYEGNTGVTDAKSFIHVNTSAGRELVGMGSKGGLQGLSEAVTNQCWECKCWQEVQFSFKPVDWLERYRSSKYVPKDVYIHLSIDDWKADIMNVAADGTFVITRMLPPGRTYFFYSEGDRVLLQSERAVGFHPRLRMERNYVDVPKDKSFQGYCQLKFRDIPCVELPDKDFLILDKPAWDPYRSPFVYRIRVSQSLFDSADVVRRAIIKDVFEHSKLVRLKVMNQEEMSSLCEDLVQVYAIIVRLYQQYAAADPKAHPYRLPWERFLKLCMDHNIIDDVCTINKIRDIFLVTNVEMEHSMANDSDVLTRFEFMEMIIRISLIKYPTSSSGLAVRQLYADSLAPCIQDRALMDNDFFRYTCLYTQPVGAVLAEREDKLKKIFKEYSTGVASRRKPRTEFKHHLTMDDFFLFLYESKVMRGEHPDFGVCDVRHVFIRSKLMVEDEEDSNCHMLLFFPDLLEAVTRLICVPVVMARVVNELKIPDGLSFTEVLGRFLDWIVDNIYFMDLASNKLIRRFPLSRHLQSFEQDKITFPYVRRILARERRQEGQHRRTTL